jgi:hypothetical protein
MRKVPQTAAQIGKKGKIVGITSISNKFGTMNVGTLELGLWLLYLVESI